MGILLYSLHVLLVSVLPFSNAHRRERLSLGDSLSIDREGDELVSPNGTFAAGFIQVGENAYCFSIWYARRPGKKTVVWMANRDKPVTTTVSEIHLNKYGTLVLISGGEGKVWETNTAFRRDVKELELLETGNLVLTNGNGEFVWQSFASPTDTLLPGQQLTRNTVLVSKRDAGNYLSGSYSFKFNDDNVVYLIYSGPEVSSVYFPLQDSAVYAQGRTNFNSTRLAAMDDMGTFSSSDLFHFNSSDYGRGPHRRLTLDHDGLLRVYSMKEPNWEWKVVWFLDIGVCRVHGMCGSYGICIYAPEPTCTCPPGFSREDPSDWSKGCVPPFNLTFDQASIDFLKFPRTDYYGYDLDTFSKNVSLENCTETCRKDHRCKGFGFKYRTCYPKFVLLNGRRTPNEPNTIYIKVPTAMAGKEGEGLALIQSSINGSGRIINTSSGKPPSGVVKNLYLRYLVGFVGTLGAMEVVIIVLGWCFIRRINRSTEPVKKGYRLHQVMGFRRFTYTELKKATTNFSEEIGRGGFGQVYRGLLEDGKTTVAIKRLEGVTQGEAEFWAEVAVVGRINHMNLVRVLGFCAEGKYRLLVYEYLQNRSLDKLLFSSDATNVLDWEKRYSIAVGTAMGLAYLHEECLEWVLHCDVKPQNILLDEHFRPKLADFGMSKFSETGAGGGDACRGKFEVSRARGTRGYMAPEWIVNQEITAKADVYSFGVVMLELVTGRSASGVHGGKWNQLVRCVEEKVEERQHEGGTMEELVDKRLQGDYDMAQVELLLRVALLCVKISKDERPAMSAVVGLLLGDDEPKNLSSPASPLVNWAIDRS
ncbi:unnamed protein product [Spirodela intermedia]|uniref:Receptor-like serine/threonine-protein kinase n=1 Tax=Spirodela intermedia TaxID=51605 RepID=A0A7I8KTF1_SPIIN|nr:unnamed protein product [Spirodela intermedia]